MKIRNTIKVIWKAAVRPLIKLYVGNFNLYIINTLNTDRSNECYSQFGQDVYVFNTIFKKREHGFFVDVGGNHPIQGNNTYLFEKHGWQGLAIEPQKYLRDLWPTVRKTECIDCVIGAEEKEITFVEADHIENGLSGVQGFNKTKHIAQTIQVQQKRLNTLLKERSVDTVDFLSIDVEGYEMNVLAGIDFTSTNIKTISIENDIGFTFLPFIGKKLGAELGNNTLRKFLKKHGYVHVARIMCDDIFIKKI